MARDTWGVLRSLLPTTTTALTYWDRVGAPAHHLLGQRRLPLRILILPKFHTWPGHVHRGENKTRPVPLSWQVSRKIIRYLEILSSDKQWNPIKFCSQYKLSSPLLNGCTLMICQCTDCFLATHNNQPTLAVLMAHMVPTLWRARLSPELRIGLRLSPTCTAGELMPGLSSNSW